MGGKIRAGGFSPSLQLTVISGTCTFLLLLYTVYKSVSTSAIGLQLQSSPLAYNMMNTVPVSGEFPLPVRELIEALRKATREAEGAGDSNPAAVFTDEDRRGWDNANSCQSRLGLKSMYARGNDATVRVAENDAWKAVLEEYSKFHRTCLKRVGNLVEYFLAKNSTIAACKFVIADNFPGDGLGNRILTTANAVLYSILTQRVVLVPPESIVPAIMCEPFVGSSWMLDNRKDDFPIPWKESYEKLWKPYQDVYGDLDHHASLINTEVSNYESSIYAVRMGQLEWQQDSRFFCDAEQTSFKGVTWLYFTGCIYTIPRFFTQPSLRRSLEALFPDRLVLTHMLRTVMLPDDFVWGRILQSKADILKRDDRLVGIQIRYRLEQDEYNRMNDVINERLLKCAVANGILPAPLGSNAIADVEAEVSQMSSPTVVKIFIASLFSGFSDMLLESYLPRPKSTGNVTVDVVQLTHDGQQSNGLSIDRQALVEMLMLSFSDFLIVSPLSTFGAVAQAYGAIVPWIVDYRDGDQYGPCERGQTVDVCNQFADLKYSCPLDPSVNGKVISEVIPYIKTCLTIDAKPYADPGLQLITTM